MPVPPLSRAGLAGLALVLAGCSGVTDQQPERSAAAPAPVQETAATASPDTGKVLELVDTEEVCAELGLTSDGLEASLVRDGTTRAQRAEALWGLETGEIARLTAGSTVTASFTTTLDLDGAGEDADVWAVAWQLIGPNDQGTWPGPPLALSVGGGEWRVGGGAGYPSGPREDYREIGLPFHDGQTVRWRVAVDLDPEEGSISLWADGHKVIDEWRPPGGTMYPGQPYLLMKVGLYTGGPTGLEGTGRLTVTDASALLERPAQGVS